MTEKLEVPRRKVRKDWYVGLHPDHVDHFHLDIHDASLVKQSSDENSISGISEIMLGSNTSTTIITSLH